MNRPPGPEPLISQALTDAVTDAMNQVGHRLGCQPLIWTIGVPLASEVRAVQGFPGGAYFDHDGERVATAWAAALGLDQQPDHFGARTWTGRVDGYEVRVWCVVDRAAFEGWGSR